MAKSNNTPIIREFILRADSQLQHQLFLLKPGTILRLVPGNEFRGLDVHFKWNYADEGHTFDRQSFTELTWQFVDPSCKYGDRFVEVPMNRPGNFDFRFWTVRDTRQTISQEYSGVFIVEPTITIGDRIVTIGGLTVQTLVPTCLGPIEEWWDRILVTANAGFNAVHFCPLQEMGSSRSPYSIRDQLRLEPSTFGCDQQHAKKLLKQFMDKARQPRADGGLDLVFLIDVVYNHTSKEAPWLVDHPEAGYSLSNTPHLKPAYVLDCAIQWFSRKLDSGLITFDDHHISAILHSESEAKFIVDVFFDTVTEYIRLWEFFVVDVEDALLEFKSIFVPNSSFPENTVARSQDVRLDSSMIVAGKSYDRFSTRLDIKAAAAALSHLSLTNAMAVIRKFLEQFNLEQYIRLDEDMTVAREAMFHTIVWERVNLRGPRKGRISRENPLVNPYFACVSAEDPSFIDDICINVSSHRSFRIPPSDVPCPLNLVDSRYILACNGWVWSADPARDFISEEKRSYLRREIVIWGDSVKLRYGDKPDDNPWLWEHMFTYTKEMAGMFSGLRIDNCHSTPKHVGQAMMDTARAANPNLIVLAELFTQSEEVDIIYTNTLGIDSLLHECMSTHSAGDYSRILHRFGGLPVGSFSSLPHHALPLLSAVPRITLLAASHDNEFPATKHTVFNSLPLFALSAMIHNGIGSTRGFEELFQANLSVVNEKRKYRPWKDSAAPGDINGVNFNTGILKPTQKLNSVHKWLEDDGFSEIYVDHLDDQCVSVTRRNPDTLEEISVFAYLVYHNHDLHVGRKTLGPLAYSGKIDTVLLRALPKDYTVDVLSHEDVAVGPNIQYDVEEDYSPLSLDTIRISIENGHPRMHIDLEPGEVVCLKFCPEKKVIDHLARIDHTLATLEASIAKYLPQLTAVDMNHVLFRCVRENESGPYKNDGAYIVPGLGSLKYAGVAGVIPVIEDIVAGNQLGHPLCDNIRSGDWLLSFISNHMRKRENTMFLSSVLDEILKGYQHIPINIKPKVFVEESFGRRLALASLQFYGIDAPYNQIDGDFALLICSSENIGKEIISLSAGLPHFAAGWMRCWGRDTFIALRGCLLIPHLFTEAKQMILAFASVVRHGLVPNLYDNGNNPRYNCRDATWFFLQSIKDFTTMNKDGISLLQEIVTRKYPTDNPSDKSTLDMPLSDVIQEIIQRHADGISFREWNAGSSIDQDMTEKGFDVDVIVKRETGFIFGGNQYNCGTWMDKMGSSFLGGNKGIPATSRDGADVEIVGLCKSVVSWLSKLFKQGHFPYAGVTESNGSTWTYENWSNTIQGNFEKYFWIPFESEPQDNFVIDSKLVHRRGIYKDVLGSTLGYSDYQLRPNVAVAMTVSPVAELFTRERAEHHLAACDRLLLGGMGMRTLDPA
eukprot:gene6020-7349_t